MNNINKKLKLIHFLCIGRLFQILHDIKGVQEKCFLSKILYMTFVIEQRKAKALSLAISNLTIHIEQPFFVPAHGGKLFTMGELGFVFRFEFNLFFWSKLLFSVLFRKIQIKFYKKLQFNVLFRKIQIKFNKDLLIIILFRKIQI